MNGTRTRHFHQVYEANIERWGILPALHLALDEFLLYDPSLMVERRFSGDANTSQESIRTACESLRRRHELHQDASCFTLCVSTNDELDKNIDLPNVVKERSLFELCWPAGHISNFFKKRSKFFHALERKYKSAPQVVYGGLTEWIYVTQGALTITLISLSDTNRLRLETRCDDEEFVPEPGTSRMIELRDKQFVAIPAGYISIKEATRLTFAYGGEMLHCDDIPAQLEAFNRDVGAQ